MAALTVRRYVTHGYSTEKLRAEMAKCDLLCANCHRKEHYEVPGGVRIGADEMCDVDE